MLDGKPVYLKYIKQGGLNEVNIHQYLSGAEDEHNHTIPILDCPETLDGGVILMTMGGGTRLDSLVVEGPASRCLRIAGQLFAGISFMHAMGVQHNDLKPSNIVVAGSDENTERVYIIDYSLATLFPDAGERCFLEGDFIGTEGWTAPEVGKGVTYNAAKADLWAAGKVVLEFFRDAGLDEETIGFIRSICEKLMDNDPDKRPQIEDVSSRVKSRLLDTLAKERLGWILVPYS